MARGVVSQISEMLEHSRRPGLPSGEIKWGKVSPAKLGVYRRVVDTFFDLLGRRCLHWHCLVVDSHRIDHSAYNEGDRDLGFTKFLYQLLLHRVGYRYRELAPYYIYLDQRTTRRAPEELRRILNRGIAKRYDIRDSPFRRVHFLDSKASQILQINDVVLGAVAARLNGHHERPHASPARVEISRHILARAGVDDLMRDTPRDGAFTVWHLRLR